ncbi:hypothetical protein [Acidovorax delafieldii]|uniref:hypothetical protein n=1 Tax=Acidovorax delafieldii TaxID=47920 RepID=UPI003ECC99D2
MTTHPLTDRRARPRTGSHTAPTHRVCAANACHQGHKACPTPQACEVTDEPPATRVELTGFALWTVGIALVIVGVLISCASD